MAAILGELRAARQELRHRSESHADRIALKARIAVLGAELGQSRMAELRALAMKPKPSPMASLPHDPSALEGLRAIVAELKDRDYCLRFDDVVGAYERRLAIIDRALSASRPRA